MCIFFYYSCVTVFTFLSVFWRINVFISRLLFAKLLTNLSNVDIIEQSKCRNIISVSVKSEKVSELSSCTACDCVEQHWPGGWYTEA